MPFDRCEKHSHSHHSKRRRSNSPDRADRKKSQKDVDRHKRRHRSHDREDDRRHRANAENRQSKRDGWKRRENEDESKYEWGKGLKIKEEPQSKADAMKEAIADKKEEPNFGLSGKLTEDTNSYKGVVITYNEPEEARKPKVRWRFYPFKAGAALPTLYVHRQSAYLIGRLRGICDLPVDHPSCSKQHAVLQYRLVGRRVSPYIIDLESANGTYLNGKRIEARRYYELKERDVIKFGFSSREYVVLHENSQGEVGENDEGLVDESDKSPQGEGAFSIKQEPTD